MDFNTYFHTTLCPYLPNRVFCSECFNSSSVPPDVWESKLSQGWRHFGDYFFRPQCLKCRACIPLRVLAQELQPSPSQRRVLRKNKDTRVEFVRRPLNKKIYQIYLDHKANRFQEYEDGFFNSYENFKLSFNPSVTNGLLSLYYVQNQLAAVGFLDETPQSFSSIYFVYKDEFKHLSLGTYSVFAECQEAARRGLKYYYLGYWIKENHFMNYKANYYPHEIMVWENYTWKRVERKPTQ